MFEKLTEYTLIYHDIKQSFIQQSTWYIKMANGKNTTPSEHFQNQTGIWNIVESDSKSPNPNSWIRNNIETQ